MGCWLSPRAAHYPVLEMKKRRGTSNHGGTVVGTRVLTRTPRWSSLTVFLWLLSGRHQLSALPLRTVPATATRPAWGHGWQPTYTAESYQGTVGFNSEVTLTAHLLELAVDAMGPTPCLAISHCPTLLSTGNNIVFAILERAKFHGSKCRKFTCIYAKITSLQNTNFREAVTANDWEPCAGDSTSYPHHSDKPASVRGKFSQMGANVCAQETSVEWHVLKHKCPFEIKKSVILAMHTKAL